MLRSVGKIMGVFGALIAVGLSGSVVLATSAAELVAKDESTHCSSVSLDKISEPLVFGTIEISGEENPLYCTFVNRANALEKLKVLVPKLLELAAEVGGLDELSEDNWSEYRRFISIVTTDVDAYERFSDDLLITNAFFDIYENDDINAEIISYVGSSDKSRSRAEEQFDLGLMLPNYAPVVMRGQKKMTNVMARASINVPAAVAYARNYASSPNTSEYGYLEGVDCTNFVSQVLEAGGVWQEAYSSKYSGWWHKKNLFGMHSYSRSWTLSDTFARYMGVGYSTQNHASFSLSITTGDFIGLDENSDGQWDHMGFVVGHAPLIQLVDGKYSDYEVAQHSSNYVRWASFTNWPRQTGATYARIRR